MKRMDAGRGAEQESGSGNPSRQEAVDIWLIWEEPAILFERSLVAEAGEPYGLPGAGRLNPLNASNMMGSCTL